MSEKTTQDSLTVKLDIECAKFKSAYRVFKIENRSRFDADAAWADFAKRTRAKR